MLEGIHSYEQRSTNEIGGEAHSRQHRLIIVDRREPNHVWSTPNHQPLADSVWLQTLQRSFSSIFTLFHRRTNEALPASSLSDTKDSSSITAHERRFEKGPFESNQWRTSRYTLLSFVPVNLFEQFKRLANFYFLTAAILQTILPFSPVGPATSLLPLVFVISTSMIKQAYEDYLRHQMDKEVNNRVCQVFRNRKLEKIRCRDIRVGDFVYVRNHEEIPCDMVLLAASGPGDRCYVTTANLDGETSLKSRSCHQILDQIGSIEHLDQTLLVIECERPNATLYEFSGYLRSPKDQASYEALVGDMRSGGAATERLHRRVNFHGANSSSVSSIILKRMKNANRNLNQTEDHKKSEFHEVPLDISNLLLRASRLRNTDHIYGLAIYTGADTKLAHNSQVKANKFSSTESSVNLFLILAFLFLLVLSAAGAAMYSRPKAWYYDGLNPPDSLSQVFIAHFLLYNYLVPISLYVTLEFIKFFGAISVIEDKKMKATVWRSITGSSVNKDDLADKKKKSRLQLEMKQVKTVEGAKCNSSDLNEELGQIEVLFSDKTGTLTENQMRFMACSVYGRMYRCIRGRLYFQPPEFFRGSIPKIAKKLALVQTNRHATIGSPYGTGNNVYDSSEKGPRVKGPVLADDISQELPFDHRTHPPLDKLKMITTLGKREELVDFFLCVCLCSTITLNESLEIAQCLPDKTDNKYDYSSASPDEESLISAAHQHGVTLCKSSDQECFIAVRLKNQSRMSASKSHLSEHKSRGARDRFRPVPEKLKVTSDNYILRHFKRLMVLEFNSIRKRMSVIYRDCDNECYLMITKGSEEMLDCIKMDDIDLKGENQIDTLLAHYEAFAKSGLRTLLVARRVLKQDQFEEIQREMNEARRSIQHRDYLMNAVYKKAETNLKLVGGTAVEDTLQRGVPETIASLKLAGIKVWLLTGDKVETAISVAYLCKLLEPGMILFHLVRQQDAVSCQKLLATFNKQMLQSRRLKSLRKSLFAHQRHHHQNLPAFALIADGRSLYYATKYARQELAELSKQCTCVLGCRLSPLQKAEVVRMIKNGPEQPITAAIGDGANDVSMIQEAHVGIGVVGKEGRQAVNCSDFAINRFQMLNRLVIVHGQLFYHRTANTIHYFFYKNVLFILPQFLYSFYNLSSGQSLYHPIFLMCFNMIFTSLPILLYGLFEVHIPEKLLESYPALYKLNVRNRLMRLPVFLGWLLSGCLQSLIAFYLLKFVWGSHSPVLESGKMSGLNGFALILYIVIVLTTTSKLYFISKLHSFSFNISSLLSCLMLPAVLYGYSLLNRTFLTRDNTLHGQVLVYFKSTTFWYAVFLTYTATVLPDILLYLWSTIKHLGLINRVLNEHN